MASSVGVAKQALQSLPSISLSKVPVQNIASTLLLSRQPIVTQDLSEFEKAFYHYQSELELRLSWTFPRWFYFKKGSMAEIRYSKLQKGPLHKTPGHWFPRGVPVVKHNRDLRKKEEINIPKPWTEGVEYSEDDTSRPLTFNSRITKADQTNDITSLERKLPRTLYLLINEKNQWKFPTFQLSPQKELSLSEVAEEGIVGLGGRLMNLWTVSNTPCHVVKKDASNKILSNKETTGITDPSIQREFFIKSHIVSGRFKPQGDFSYAWLSKEEISEKLDESYYNHIQHLLSDN